MTDSTTFLYWLAHLIITWLILRGIYNWLMAIPCKFEEAERESDNEQGRFDNSEEVPGE